MLIQPLRAVGKAVVNAERTRWRQVIRESIRSLEGLRLDEAEVRRHLSISFSVWMHKDSDEMREFIDLAIEANRSRPLSVCSFIGARDTHPNGESIHWRELAGRLTTFDRPASGEKTDLHAWSPCSYKSGTTRGAKNVVEVSCIVLDIDSDSRPVSIEEACKPWQGVAHCVHTSWSHTVERPKFRVVIPLARAVKAKHWARVWAWAERRAGVEVDGKCKDPSRLYFIPALRSPDAPHRAFVSEGPMLELPADAFVPTRRERTAQKWKEAAQIPAMRQFSPVGDYARRVAKYSPEERERIGLALGGFVDDHGVVRDVVCPGCGRASLFWGVTPKGGPRAMCRHRSSCGGTFDLVDLKGA